jgi:6,7-dimethyl-8-ribityllumazine synthase
MTDFEGSFTVAGDERFAIVVGRFNSFISERLARGAADVLRRHGIDDSHIDRIFVPGAWEIPLALERLAGSGRYTAAVAVGCVIRGATPHFDYVAGECARGIARVSLDSGLPIGFGVLTVETVEQAIDRAGTKSGNKGADAAMAALEMAGLVRALDGAGGSAAPA